MAHAELAAFAAGSLRHRSTRSWLTVMGIVIGIAAIVILVSLGYGINSYIDSQLEAFGSNFVSIAAGSPRAGFSFTSSSPFMGTRSAILTTKDMDAARSVGGVASVYGVLAGRGDVSYRGETVTGGVSGISAGAFNDFAKMLPIGEGRAITEADSHVAVIGGHLANETFKNDVLVNRALVIGNVSYRVIGILGDTGSSPIPTGSVIFIPFRDAQEFFDGVKSPGQVDMILVRTSAGSDPDAVAAEIKAKLFNTRHVNDETQDFKVNTASSLTSNLGAITGTLSLFLGGIAAIALVVGGVGIANTMFMAVTERTREIGIMKAIGARERDILEVFLIESALLGLIGGVLGVLVGVAVSYAMNALGVPSTLKPELLGGAVLFSLLVGMVSGFYPARQAARLEPVAALGFA